MKKLAVLLLVVVVNAAYSEPVSGGAFVWRKMITSTNGVAWTNRIERPLELKSMQVVATGSVSVALSQTARFDYEFQRRPPAVVTNEFGEVVTNYYTQVTNVLVYQRSLTYGPFGITNAGVVRAELEGAFSTEGDVWLVTAPSGTAVWLNFLLR